MTIPEILASKRFATSWLRLSREELTVQERIVALDGVRRLLAAAGQDMDSLLKHAAIGFQKAEADKAEAAERVREEAAERVRPRTHKERFEEAMRREDARSSAGNADPFGPGLSDIGDVLGTSRPTRRGSRFADPIISREEEARWASLRPVVGESVPATIVGKVVLPERMTLRDVTMLSFRVENQVAMYGPLFATEMTTIETIEAAERHSARISVFTHRHPGRKDIPLVQRVSIAD